MRRGKYTWPKETHRGANTPVCSLRSGKKMVSSELQSFPELSHRVLLTKHAYTGKCTCSHKRLIPCPHKIKVTSHWASLPRNKGGHGDPFTHTAAWKWWWNLSAGCWGGCISTTQSTQGYSPGMCTRGVLPPQ